MYILENNFELQNYECYFNCILSGSEMKTSAFTTQYCLTIQCSKDDKTFLEQSCDTVLAQICNTTCK